MYCPMYQRCEIRRDMVRGLLQAAGLAAVIVAFSLSVMHAQRGAGDPEINVLREKSVENRQRIQALESGAASVGTRLARIETELEISRRVAESNGQLMTGLFVGICLMIAERLFALLTDRKRDT